MSGNELSTDTIPSNNLAGITSANGELWYITASGERGIHRFQPN